MKDKETETLKLPVKAVKRPFGDWMWFLDDANGKPVAQIMPSTDEAMARALADLINRPATLEDRALAEMIKAAEHMDWIQVVLNGGPPCFHLDDDCRFCGRAEQWEGHGEFHEFKPLDALLREAGRVK